MGRNNNKGSKSGNGKPHGNAEDQKGKGKITFATESKVDKEKVALQNISSDSNEEDQKPGVAENGIPKKETPKSTPRFNAFQRLLIKLGGINVPDEPDPEIEEAQKKKVEELEQEVAKLDKKVHDNEVVMTDCLLKLQPEYYNQSIEPNQLSNTLLREVDNLKKVAAERLSDLGKLQKEVARASENLEVKVVETSLPEASPNKVEANKEVGRSIKAEEFEAFKRKELEEKNRLREEKNALQKKYDQLNKDAALKRSKIESLEGELKKREQAVGSLETQLHQANTKLNEEIEAHNKLIEDKDKLIKEKSDKIAQMVETEKRASEVLKKVQEDNKQLRASDIGEVTARLEGAQDDIANLKETISAHEATIADKNDEIKALNSAIESKEAAYITLLEAKAGVDAKLKETEGKLGDAQQEINAANTTINRQAKEIERDAKIIKEKDEMIEDNISKINDLDGKLNVSIDALNAANNEIERQKGIVVTRDQEIVGLNGKIDSLTSDLGEVKKELGISKQTASESVEDFCASIIKEAEAALEVLNEGRYELGQGEMGETCADDEDVNKRRFNKLVTRLKGIAPDAYKTVGDLRKVFLDMLSEEVNKEAEGIITPLARLCAYSRLPFMREDQGEDYMMLDPKRLGRLEQHLKGMLAMVGIELIIPTPFCDNVHEGDFEARPGEIPNLDYICPNARQHLDKVDRYNTEDIITDIVCVGYRIPGQADQKAKVIL